MGREDTGLSTIAALPRAGSQSYPSPAAGTNADGSFTLYFLPQQPPGVTRGNWIQTIPGKSFMPCLRLYSPLESFFANTWRPSEVELVNYVRPSTFGTVVREEAERPTLREAWAVKTDAWVQIIRA